MLLLIAHHYDAEARWLRQALATTHRVPIVYLVPEALGLDYSVCLHLNNSGRQGATVYFQNPKLEFSASDAWYAINRLTYIDPILWQHASPPERTYAASEINAFFSALIESLPCPVSNRIHNGALYGDVGFAVRWATRMHERGLLVDSLVTDESGKVYEKLHGCDAGNLYRFLYNGEEIITPPSQITLRMEQTIRDCILSQNEGESLEFIFLNEGEAPRLLHVSKMPSLACYGHRYIDALVQQLERLKP